MQEMNNGNANERTIDVTRLLKTVWKWKYLILVLTLLAGIAGYLYSWLFITPSYQSSFTAYVNNRQITSENQTGTSSSDLNVSKGLAYLYQQIITSRSVLTEAAQAAGLDYPYGVLYYMVSTTVAENTAVISVYVTAADPNEAAALATAIADVAPEHVARVVDGSSMRIVDAPVASQHPYAPDSVHNGSVCAAVVLSISIIVVVALDIFNDKVHSEKEIEERYKIAVVGSIPDIVQAEKGQQTRGTGKNGRYRK